jgi:hypothetical protein
MSQELPLAAILIRQKTLERKDWAAGHRLVGDRLRAGLDIRVHQQLDVVLAREQPLYRTKTEQFLRQLASYGLLPDCHKNLRSVLRGC